MVDQDIVDDLEGLVDLVAGMEDIKSVLDGLTGLAAASMSSSTGVPIECAVTLHRRKRTATIGGSSGRAVVIDRIEQSLGDGPCIEALERGVPVLLGDVSSDPRWPEYRSALSAAGIAGSLGIPMNLEGDAGAVLDYFAPVSGLFDEQSVADGLRFADMAGKALRLAVRIASADQRAENMKSPWTPGRQLIWPAESSWRRTSAPKTGLSRSSAAPPTHGIKSSMSWPNRS